MQLGLPLCADVSFVFRKYQGRDKNDKGLLVGRPIAPKPDKYIGLDLTLIRCIETSVMCTSEILRHIRNNTNVYDASDEAVRIETEVEVDIMRLR